MYLSIDLGSTSFKAAVFDSDLRVIGSGSCGIDYEFGDAGEVELPVAASSEALSEAIPAALSAAGVAPQELSAIAITSQAQTFTVIDRTGRPRRPFISWQDNRAVKTAARLERLPTFADFAEHSSFGTLYPALQVCLVRHILDREPDAVGPADRVLKLPSYLARLLTGEALLDENLAAMSGFYSLKCGGWWTPAFAACGLVPEQFPRLCPIGTVAARTSEGARAFGLAPGIPVIMAGNDQTAGAFGARVHEHNALLITLGTAQVAYACLDALPMPRPETVRGGYPDGRYYLMCADSAGGNSIAWACGILPGCAEAAAFDACAATSPAGAHGLSFHPDGAAGSGTWRGERPEHNVADRARAVVEALCARMADMVRRLGLDLAHTPVMVAGGGTHSRLWLDLLGGELGVTLVTTDANPLAGAASMARAAVC